MKWKIPVLFAAVGAGLLALLSGKATPAPEAPPTTPPAPGGAKAPPWNPPAPGPPLPQSEVTPAMTSWAVGLVASGAPMHSLHPRDFDGVSVIGRVEWHTVQASTGKHGLFRACSIYRGGGIA